MEYLDGYTFGTHAPTDTSGTRVWVKGPAGTFEAGWDYALSDSITDQAAAILSDNGITVTGVVAILGGYVLVAAIDQTLS